MNKFDRQASMILILITLLAGCATEPDLTENAFAQSDTAGSEFHPKGARLNRDEAIALGARAFEQQGFLLQDLGDPRAFYVGPTRGTFGVKHRDWIVSFNNKSSTSAARYPSLSVYVDDRSGKTEVVEKEARP